MEYQWFEFFLASPNLSDMVSYVLLVAGYIGMFFVRKFVQKDNKNTLFKVDRDVKTVKFLENKLDSVLKDSVDREKKWEEEKANLLQEIELLKTSLQLIANNVQDLVKAGVAHEVNKVLQVEKEKQISEIDLSEQAEVKND